MRFFRKKKIYCVEWHSVWGIYRRDYIKATDVANAWAIIKRKNVGISCVCDKITEIIPGSSIMD